MFYIVSFYILALLTLFSVSITQGSRSELRMVSLALAETQARFLAESGVARAMAALATDSTPSTDALNEEWAGSLGGLSGQFASGGTFFVGHRAGAAFSDTIPGVVDEERKLHLLMARPEVLARLPQFPPALLWAFEEWKASGAAVSPGLLELASMARLSADEYERASQVVTTFGQGKVNINTSGPEILTALGVSASLVNKIEQFRRGRDGQTGTKDDGVFSSVNEIAKALGEVGELSLRESAEAAWLQSAGVVTVSSHYFRIHSIGRTERGTGRVCVDVVVHRADRGSLTIVEWSES